MVNFKNEKLLNTLRKATLGKQIGEVGQVPEQEVKFDSSEQDYFTGSESDAEGDFSVDEEEW